MRLKKNKTVSMILVAVFFVCFLVLLLGIHPFLAMDRPVDADILVVEGWIAGNDDAVSQALAEFGKGNYRHLVVVGGPAPGGKESEGGATYADLAAEEILQHGFDKELLHVVRVPPVQKRHSFSMALAFRIWLEKSRIKTKGVNVYTFGVHARKSEAVFKQVLEPDIQVGVLSAKPLHYDPRFWWLTRVGWKWVFYDFAKYIRAII